ncbi:MAG: M14 family zinc carboxypeptidase [Flavobacteriales bacterium]
MRAQSDPLGLPDNSTTPTWSEIISLYGALADAHDDVHLVPIGNTDVGRPLHAVVAGVKSISLPLPGLAGISTLKTKHPERPRILVNNGIHPGEPCGVDASLAHLRQRLQSPKRFDNQIWIYIPLYNIGGGLQRNCCSRANQNGPDEYGFRGNARNLDLNRDFVKADSRNALAFVRLLTAFDPDVLVDTHTTNGADYPHNMTLITSQHDKAGPVLGPFLREVVDPFLYAGMKDRDNPMVPYVFAHKQIPDSGIIGFLETPRYSTGYAMLKGTLGFVTEAHMLKPFEDRVEATLDFLECIWDLANDHGSAIQTARQAEKTRWFESDSLAVRWKRHPSKSTPLTFTGYKAVYETSSITGGERLRYDRSEPWTAEIPFYNHYEPTRYAHIPEAWLLPQAWHEVQERLKAAGVHFERVTADTIVEVEVTRIASYSAPRTPYEGHFTLRIDSVQTSLEPVRLFAGDFIIPREGNPVRLLAELLDPMAHDAFLVWNFFDSTLQQKEYYSAYVFEDEAEFLLQNDEVLAAEFAEALAQDTSLSKSPSSQIRWLYEHSQHFEGKGGVVNMYPVYKLN